jgi:hypothetical protein
MACIVGDVGSEYISIDAFKACYAGCKRLKPYTMYRWRRPRRVLCALTPPFWYWKMRLECWYEQHNPYIRLREVEASRTFLIDLLNHASCVCGVNFGTLWAES